MGYTWNIFHCTEKNWIDRWHVSVKQAWLQAKHSLNLFVLCRDWIFKSEKILLVLVCEIHSWVSCFLYSIEICCLSFFRRCFTKLCCILWPVFGCCALQMLIFNAKSSKNCRALKWIQYGRVGTEGRECYLVMCARATIKYQYVSRNVAYSWIMVG